MKYLKQELQEAIKKSTNPLRAIRQQCLICVGSSDMVKDCTGPCTLHKYRFGINPDHKVNLTDEQRLNRSNRAKEMLQKRQLNKKSVQD